MVACYAFVGEEEAAAVVEEKYSTNGYAAVGGNGGDWVGKRNQEGVRRFHT